MLGDVRILRSSGEPCIVCGEKGGNCRGGAISPIRLLGESFAKKNEEPGFLVEKDIFEEVFITDFTKTKVLVARAGAYIPLDKAKELGLL